MTVSKMYGIYTQWNTIILLRRDKITQFDAVWVNLESILLSEVS